MSDESIRVWRVWDNLDAIMSYCLNSWIPLLYLRPSMEAKKIHHNAKTATRDSYFNSFMLQGSHDFNSCVWHELCPFPRGPTSRPSLVKSGFYQLLVTDALFGPKSGPAGTSLSIQDLYVAICHSTCIRAAAFLLAGYWRLGEKNKNSIRKRNKTVTSWKREKSIQF